MPDASSTLLDHGARLRASQRPWQVVKRSHQTMMEPSMGSLRWMDIVEGDAAIRRIPSQGIRGAGPSPGALAELHHSRKTSGARQFTRQEPRGRPFPESAPSTTVVPC